MGEQGQVFQKLIFANPGLKVNYSIVFFEIHVSCSLRSFRLKTEDKKYKTANLTEKPVGKVTKLKVQFSFIPV